MYASFSTISAAPHPPTTSPMMSKGVCHAALLRLLIPASARARYFSSTMQRAVPRLRFCLTRAASSSAPKDHWDALDMSGHSLASLFSDAATVPKNDDEGKSLKTRLLERSACDVFLQPHERPPARSDQPFLVDPYAHLEAARLRIRERFERKFLRPEIPSVLEAVKQLETSPGGIARPVVMPLLCPCSASLASVVCVLLVCCSRRGATRM